MCQPYSLPINERFFTRCIGDHGREARFPFLDENVVSYLQSLPMNDKVILQCIGYCITFYDYGMYCTIGGLHAATWGRREIPLEKCSPYPWLYSFITITQTGHTVWI